MAITDWIHENVEYLRGSTDSMTSAYDTVTQRTGVCRDFSHLGIALCRALNIPARYFSGYAYQLEPPDFHACFECFIGGSWVVFDATRLAHLNGLVRIGTGRDAADAAVASIFGSAIVHPHQVGCDARRRAEVRAGRPQAAQPARRRARAVGVSRRPMRLHIEHATSYVYERPVSFGRHRLVLRPREGHDLRVERMQLRLEPAHRLPWIRDVFGNSIALVDWLEPADVLTIVNDVIVERLTPFPGRELHEPWRVPFPPQIRSARDARSPASISRRRSRRRGGRAGMAGRRRSTADAATMPKGRCWRCAGWCSRTVKYQRRIGEGRADSGAHARARAPARAATWRR